VTSPGAAARSRASGLRSIALIGDPVAQSISPAMHRAAFEALGLHLDYVALRVTSQELPRAFPALRERLLGLNVTRPLKEDIVPLLDGVSPEAARAGSVNTVTFRGGRAEGHSTDGSGFLSALERSGAPPPSRALVLGTGGAARAVAAALQAVGASVAVSGRNVEAGRRLVSDLGVPPDLAPAARAAPAGVEFLPLEQHRLAEALAAADLLVNAIPTGGRPAWESSPLLEEVPLRPGLTVFDLVYRPRCTALLARAQAARCRVVEGVEMLVEQGAASFELWTAVRAPVEAMRAAAYGALEQTPAGRGGATPAVPGRGGPG